MKILRKIFGPNNENGIWRIKTNQELDEIIKRKNIINSIRAQRLSWLGHIERIQGMRMVKAVYCWKPTSRRPIGRPKIRWVDDVRKDIQKLKVPNWKTLAQDRKSWLRGPKLYKRVVEPHKKKKKANARVKPAKTGHGPHFS
jgi:hypothetical protein